MGNNEENLVRLVASDQKSARSFVLTFIKAFRRERLLDGTLLKVVSKFSPSFGGREAKDEGILAPLSL